MPLGGYGEVAPMASQPRSMSRISSQGWRVRTRTSSRQLTPSGANRAIQTKVETDQPTRSARTLYRALWVVAALSAAQAPTLRASDFGVVRMREDAAAAFAEHIAVDSRLDCRSAGTARGCGAAGCRRVCLRHPRRHVRAGSAAFSNSRARWHANASGDAPVEEECLHGSA